MKKNLAKLLTPPEWFRCENAQQEDTVRGMYAQHQALEDTQTRTFEEAKARAMPRMAETVRDWDSRPDSMITGEIRPWTDEAWHRVRRNKMKKDHPFLYWISYFFPSKRYG